jgi:DNA-binding response OmpR family regulator
MNGPVTKRIMILDDEPDVVEALKLGMTRNGYTVDAYTDPLKAVEDFEEGKYDLVLLDIRMPHKNGFDVYRELRKVDKNVKVCFLTAFEVYKNEFSKLFPDLDVQYFLRKPISLSELKKRIDEMIGLS